MGDVAVPQLQTSLPKDRSSYEVRLPLLTSQDFTEPSAILSRQNQNLEDPDDGYHQASFSSAVFNLSTTIVGAGIMALPAAMKVTGLPLGLLAIVVAGFLTNASIGFLNRFSQPCKARSYGGLMADSFGKSGKTLTQLFIVMNNGGVLIVYMIIIAGGRSQVNENLSKLCCWIRNITTTVSLNPENALDRCLYSDSSQVWDTLGLESIRGLPASKGDVLSGTKGSEHSGILVEWAGGLTWWNGRVVVLFVTMILILVPLSSLRHVDSLKHSSALSMGLAVVFLIITMTVTLLKLSEGKIDAPRLLPDIHDEYSFWRLFTVVPVMVTAFICHHNLHPIANELQGPIESQMHSISRAAMVICSSIYVATALFGYLLFGENISSDILSNFDIDLDVPYSSFICAAVQISYVVHIMLVFPLLNFSLRLNLDSFLFPKARPLAEDSMRFTLLTAALMGIIFFGSTLVPNIWVVFEFTGATATVCLGFIFPGAIVLRDAAGIATRKDKWLAAAMVILAVISSVSAITTNIYDLFAVEHR